MERSGLRPWLAKQVAAKRRSGSAGPQWVCEDCAVPEGTRYFFQLYSGLTPWAKSNSTPAGLDFEQSFHRGNSKRVLTQAL